MKISNVTFEDSFAAINVAKHALDLASLFDRDASVLPPNISKMSLTRWTRRSS